MELKRTAFGKVEHYESCTPPPPFTPPGRKYVYQDVDELDKDHRQNDDPSDNIPDARMFKWKTVTPAQLKTLNFICQSRLNKRKLELRQRPKVCILSDSNTWYCCSLMGKILLDPL